MKISTAFMLLLAGLFVMAIAVNVKAQAPISVGAKLNIAWTAPTARTNGTPINCEELAGYEIYYFVEGSGISDAGAGNVIPLSNGCATNHVFDSSVSTTAADAIDGEVRLVFAISATDTGARKSAISDYVVVPISVPQSIVDQLQNSPPNAPVIVSASGTIEILIE